MKIKFNPLWIVIPLIFSFPFTFFYQLTLGWASGPTLILIAALCSMKRPSYLACYIAETGRCALVEQVMQVPPSRLLLPLFLSASSGHICCHTGFISSWLHGASVVCRHGGAGFFKHPLCKMTKSSCCRWVDWAAWTRDSHPVRESIWQHGLSSLQRNCARFRQFTECLVNKCTLCGGIEILKLLFSRH